MMATQFTVSEVVSFVQKEVGPIYDKLYAKIEEIGELKKEIIDLRDKILTLERENERLKSK